MTDPSALTRRPGKSGLQRGEVVARGYRVGMVRPEARLENRQRAAHQRLGLGEAVRVMKQCREIVEALATSG